MSNEEDIERCDCGYETGDVFEMFEHTGVELDWRLKVTPSFSFNLFLFLKEMSQLSREGRSDEVYEHLQSLSYLLYKVSEDNRYVENKLKDLYCENEAEQLISDLERMLDNNG